MVLSFFFLNPTILVPNSDDSVHATDTPATSGEAANSLVTLNLSLTRPNASVELTPHDTYGTFASSSASSSAEFDVSTNNYTGYTLSLASSTNNDDGKLTNTDTNIVTNNTLSSISSVTSESDFSSTSSTNLNNKWGYKPSKYNGSDNTSYIPAPSITNPTTNSAILDTTSTYNTTKAGGSITTETNTEDIDANTYTIGLGARVDYTVATGSYENNFILQVVGNPVPVTLSYTDTSGDASVTSTLPSTYNGSVSETRAPISTTIPTRTGFTFKSWCLGTVTPGVETGVAATNYVDTCTGTTYNPSTTENTQYIGVDLTHSNTMTLVAMWERNKYTITLDGNGATTNGSASATAAYGITTLSTITNPQRKYNVSGFSLTSSAANATISSTATKTAAYTFNGWYKESGATTKVASNATTPVLEASVSGLTNASKEWIGTGNTNLYAGWTSTSVTLPTITRTGSTCGWSIASDATTITYDSGASFTPTANTTLYGVCVNDLTMNLNGGTGGTTSAKVAYGSTTITSNNGGNLTNPTRANGSSSRTVSGFTKTASATNSTVSSTSDLTSSATITYTFNGWHKDSGTGTLVASTAVKPVLTKSNGYTDANGKWNYTTASAVTLYAGWNSSTGSYSAVTLPTITRTGSTCGWSTASDATTITYDSGASFTPTANTTLYGVCVTNITLDRNGGNAGSTSTTVNYGSTTLGSITVPTKANSTYSVSGFTKTTSATNSTVSGTSSLTSTQTYAFKGWYTASSGGTNVANTAATPALTASNGYTNSSKQWTYTTAGEVKFYAQWTPSGYSAVTLPSVTRTGSTCGWSTASDATTITYGSGASFTPTGNTTLYAVCVNDITLNNSGATTEGSTSATVNYNATALSAITLPQRKYTVSGFTKSTSASSATVSNTNTLTNTATFNGWYTATSGGTKIAAGGTDTTPDLQASTTYTNGSKQWTYTTAGAITLNSQWTDNSVTLPTITLSGYDCHWNTNSSDTGTSYNSGASITPTSNLTLTGFCTIKSNLSLKVSFNSTYVSSVKVCTTAGDCSGSNLKGTVSTSGNSVSGLTYNTAYYLYPTYTTGSKLSSWAKDSGAVGTLSSTSAANPTYTIGDGTNAVTHNGARQTYTVTLDQCSATTNGSTSATATYYSTTLSSITLPQRQYTASGFTLGTAGANAAVSSTSALTSTYTFGGWVTSSCSGTTTVASNATTPALSASVSGITDSSKHWTATSAQTFYAKWTSASITLPTITRTGSTCGWATDSSATTWTYNSGASITPTGNLTLYGVCRNNITLSNSGATTNGSTSATVNYNATALSTIALPQRKYTVSGFTKTTSATNSSVSSTSTLTNTATFNGWYTAASGGAKIAAGGTDTTPDLQASTTYTNGSKQWTYTTASAVTLYSQFTDNSVTLPTITRTGSTCGWATSDSATTWNYSSGASITPTSNLTLYGVCRNNLTMNLNGGTGGTTSAIVKYNDTVITNTSGGNLTNPTKANGSSSRTVSGFTKPSGNNASGATVSSTSSLTSTATITYTFKGWYKESGATTQIASTAVKPVLTTSNGYTDANGKWNYTTASAVTLYAGWNSSTGNYSAVTLPTITKTGYSCGWTTTSTGATTITYESGASITPSGNLTLYGVCTANKYSLTINFAGSGVSSVQVRTASGTGGTLMGTVSTSGNKVENLVFDTKYYLYPTFTSGYELDNWAKISGEGTLSSTSAFNPEFTIGVGDGAVTVTGRSSCVAISGTMQAFNPTASTCTSGTLKDSRDNKSYTVAKLADGKWWMTSNLDLAGGTALSASDTDVDASYISSFTTGYSLTKSGDSIVLPASSTSGFSNYRHAYVYNSGSTTCGEDSPCYSYYSWNAATLGSGRSMSTDNTDAPYSICPKGWKLPSTYNGSGTAAAATDFRALMIAYGGSDSIETYDSSTSPTGATMYGNIGPGTTPNFLLAGSYGNGSFSDGGSYWGYWSSTSESSTRRAHYLSFFSDDGKFEDVYSASSSSRYLGLSVRCLLR